MPLSLRYFLPRISNKPNVTASAVSVANSTETLTIRPPIGQIWQLLLATVQLTAVPSVAANTFVEGRIQLNKDGTVYVLRYTSKALFGANFGSNFARSSYGASVGYSSDGPILLTNSEYLVMAIQSTDAGASSTGDMIAVTRRI